MSTTLELHYVMDCINSVSSVVWDTLGFIAAQVYYYFYCVTQNFREQLNAYFIFIAPSSSNLSEQGNCLIFDSQQKANSLIYADISQTLIT